MADAPAADTKAPAADASSAPISGIPAPAAPAQPTVDKNGKRIDIKDPDGKIMMHVKVYSPFKNYFDDNAYSITAINGSGPFDILPHHHNFMTMVEACDMTIAALGGDKKIRISRGMMHIKADQVVVFLDI